MGAPGCGCAASERVWRWTVRRADARVDSAAKTFGIGFRGITRATGAPSWHCRSGGAVKTDIMTPCKDKSGRRTVTRMGNAKIL